ncbi:MAG: hypothetical protein GSR80_000717 [Desulfurococcales archaeon]|nr:hypothetical protein [Desulfurococcales archaeon]
MTGLRSLPARLLVVLGLSIIIAGIASAYAGPKMIATYNGVRTPMNGEIVGITIWAMSTSGNVTVKARGVGEILYTIVKGDPIGFFTNASAFGVHAEAIDMSHDIRSGVFFASARVRLDPLTLIYISKKLSRANDSSIAYSLPQGESLVLILIPAKYGEPVRYNVTFHVTGYERLSTTQLIGLGTGVASLGLLWLAVLKIKTRRLGAGRGVE